MKYIALAAAGALAACATQTGAPAQYDVAADVQSNTTMTITTADRASAVVARLPEAVSNNAVAAARVDGRAMAYSFAGLHAGKTWRDLTADAYECDLAAGRCAEIAGLPDGVGRLAAVAATLEDRIYIFGGYTVAGDGSEKSTPEVWIFDPAARTYSRAADMPTPVDDAVALPVGGRYIYLVSGWHDTDNVDLVQLYDAQRDEWRQATPWPGAPVFGHAGGVIADPPQTGGPQMAHMVICDGVKVVPGSKPGEDRRFEPSAECWEGRADIAQPEIIDWTQRDSLPPAHYRMAATGSARLGLTVFIGGTDNPYNYNGVGYDGAPSDPSAHAWGYDFAAREFAVLANPDTGTMDHRGLIEWNGRFVTLGGMNADRQVMDAVIAHDIGLTE